MNENPNRPPDSRAGEFRRVAIFGSGPIRAFVERNYYDTYFVNCSESMHRRDVAHLQAPRTLIINNWQVRLMKPACRDAVVRTSWNKILVTELEKPRLTEELVQMFIIAGHNPTIVHRDALQSALYGATGLRETVLNSDVFNPRFGLRLATSLCSRWSRSPRLAPPQFRVSTGIYALALAKAFYPDVGIEAFGFSFRKKSRVIYADGSVNVLYSHRHIDHVRPDRIAIGRLQKVGICVK